MSEKILCLDFDGVVHDYREGWKDGSIYGELTPGFKKWAEQARPYFKLVVCSSRTAHEQGLADVRRWLDERDLGWITVTAHKPPAFLTIDDRSLLFLGNWAHFSPPSLVSFQPWGVKRG